MRFGVRWVLHYAKRLHSFSLNDTPLRWCAVELWKVAEGCLRSFWSGCKNCKRHSFPLFAKKARKLKNQSPRYHSFSQIMKVENFIFSPSRLVTQPCSLFVGLSLLQRWKVSLLVLNYCWLSLPFKWEKTSAMARRTSTIELLQLSFLRRQLVVINDGYIQLSFIS